MELTLQVVNRHHFIKLNRISVLLRLNDIVYEYFVCISAAVKSGAELLYNIKMETIRIC